VLTRHGQARAATAAGGGPGGLTKGTTANSNPSLAEGADDEVAYADHHFEITAIEVPAPVWAPSWPLSAALMRPRLPPSYASRTHGVACRATPPPRQAILATVSTLHSQQFRAINEEAKDALLYFDTTSTISVLLPFAVQVRRPPLYHAPTSPCFRLICISRSSSSSSAPGKNPQREKRVVGVAVAPCLARKVPPEPHRRARKRGVYEFDLVGQETGPVPVAPQAGIGALPGTDCLGRYACRWGVCTDTLVPPPPPHMWLIGWFCGGAGRNGGAPGGT